MKKLLLLSVVAFFATVANAQNKHDNEIVIKGVSVKQAINAFMDAGYNIDRYDTTIGFVYTSPLQAKKTAAIVVFTARVKDSVLVVTGKFRSVVNFGAIMFRDNSIDNSSNYLPVEFRGMKGSTYMDSWNAMDKLAKSFGQPVSYAKL